MTFLRDRWRRSFIVTYFEGLEPIDRATALIAIGLALAVGLSFSAIALRAPL